MKPVNSATQPRLAWPASRWLLVACIWTAMGIGLGGQIHVMSLRAGKSGTWWGAILIGLTAWYLWAFLCPLIFWIAARFPLEGTIWRRNLAAHALAGPAVALIYSSLHLWVTDTVLVGWLGDAAPFPPAWAVHAGVREGFFQRLGHNVSTRMFFQLNNYAALVAIWHGLNYSRRLRERDEQAKELARHLTEARLQALRTQLQPHFLFNTLNAISGLVHQHPKVADEMISNLSELLRSTLGEGQAQEVSLRDELGVLGRYLDIEKVRFGDRLVVEEQIEPGVLDALVPSLLLQPLAENAVRHGIEPRRNVGRLRVEAFREGEGLVLRVIDNGRGLPEAGTTVQEGVGLGTTRARLHELYGPAASLTLRAREGEGLVAEIRMPLRRLGSARVDAPQGIASSDPRPAGRPATATAATTP